MAMKEWSTGQKVGCGCLVVALILVGACATLVFGVFGLIKSSSPYEESLEIVKANPEVRAFLGEPIEAQFWASGTINVELNSGKADLTYGVQGPNGSGNVRVYGTKTGGEWSYTTIRFDADEEALSIDLLAGSTESTGTTVEAEPNQPVTDP